MALRKQKTVTVTAIAKEVGLSAGAVSFVLSGQAKKRGISDNTADIVRRAAIRMGYVPNYWAQSLQSSRTGLISILFDSLEMNWAGRIMDGVTEVLSEGSHTPVLGLYYKMPLLERDITGIKHREILGALKRRDEGIVCTPRMQVREDYKVILNHGLPLVFIGATLNDMSGLDRASSVSWDCGPAAKKVVQHLIKSGRKKIAFVGAHHGVVSDQTRFDAYKSALQEAGIPFNEKWVVWGPAYASVSIEDIKTLFEDESDKPDAIFAINDSVAITLLEMLDFLGINVPSDVSLAGMGDLSITRVKNVGITTVNEPLEEIGSKAARLLLNLAENPAMKPVHLKIVGEDLKIRRTTNN